MESERQREGERGERREGAKLIQLGSAKRNTLAPEPDSGLFTLFAANKSDPEELSGIRRESRKILADGSRISASETCS